MLKEFSTEAVTQWMNGHQNIKIISRDGSLKFKQAIKEANHAMIQVTDRWHLIHNLNERMDRILPKIVDARIPGKDDDPSMNQEFKSVSEKSKREQQKEQLMRQVKNL